MPDYDFSHLNNRLFEQLVQALSAKILGPSVSIFGDGPDGGREATFEGRVSFPSIHNSWDGYGVIQAKFRQRSVGIKDDGDWAISQLKSEIEKYLDPKLGYRKPEYFIFATNLVLTPVRERGSKDRLTAILQDFGNRLPLKGYDIWDYDKLRVFLDGDEGVRRAYTAWITPGDVLAETIERLSPRSPLFLETLHNFLEKEMLSDEYVNLEQAGHDANERISLARIFVDLPTVDEGHGLIAREAGHSRQSLTEEGHNSNVDLGFVKQMLAISRERLDPKSQEVRSIVSRPDAEASRHPSGRFVLIGGPGQGKTTVGQFICQIFRASIINRRAGHSISLETQRALSLIKNHCQEEGLELSLVPRFPFRIVLNEFASALSSDNLPQVNSVLSFLVYKIQNRTDRSVTLEDVLQWLSRYPSIVVFDGLDEVPSSSNRDQVLQSIRDFWIDVTSINADILSIATSRPQGYNEDFSPDLYQHQRLTPLTKEFGKHFAKRLADVRYGSDMDRRQKVLDRLERAFDSESTFRLMRSPLQITIMAALVDQMGQPPQARWNLFNSYYQVIYKREVERDIPASSILRRFQPDINAIHSRVGLLLQVDSEHSGRTDARLSRERFVSLVTKRLEEEGHEGDGLKSLTKQIVNAAAERLVFLVGLESDQVGFEIRSLQEFMASECLMGGKDVEVRNRLREIAPLPNWRNVFLFAAGKCFTERQHLREAIHSICGTLNETNGDRVSGEYLAGSSLAIDILDDGLTRNQPRFARSFARTALRALDVPNDEFHVHLAGVYEPQLEQVYLSEVSRRIMDPRKGASLGAWHCLLRLVERNVHWAKELAEKNWPSNTDEQVSILEGSIGFWRNHWAAAKFLELLPIMRVSLLRDIYHTGMMRTSYEASSHYRMDASTVHGEELPPERVAMIKVLEGSDFRLLPRIAFLGDGYFGIPTIIRPSDDSSWFLQLQSLEGIHPSWVVYKSASTFLQNPTKDSLANMLKEIAPLISSESNEGDFLWPTMVPWPLAACLTMCHTESDALEMAKRARSGDLGDVDDWLRAQKRWTIDGVTEKDISSMTDERLPFDMCIGASGFPVSLAPLPDFRSYSEETPQFQRVLNFHSKLRTKKSRSFAAYLIHMRLVGMHLLRLRSDLECEVELNLQDVLRIYEDLPAGFPVPLDVVFDHIRGTNQEVVDFFRLLKQRNRGFHTLSIHRAFKKDRLEELGRVFSKEREFSLLAFVFGTLAESGQLPRNLVDIPGPEAFSKSDDKMSALVIKLAQESWETDRVGLLIKHIKEIGNAETEPEFYERIVGTLERNRPTSRIFERFLVDLRKILPRDCYELRSRHMRLLGDALSRRTTRFSDPAEWKRFAFPVGIVELL